MSIYWKAMRNKLKQHIYEIFPHYTSKMWFFCTLYCIVDLRTTLRIQRGQRWAFRLMRTFGNIRWYWGFLDKYARVEAFLEIDTGVFERFFWYTDTFMSFLKTYVAGTIDFFGKICWYLGLFRRAFEWSSYWFFNT